MSRIILLVLDNAGWHGPANLKVPDGIRLIHLPPYSPELQPAETLWSVVDEPRRFYSEADQLRRAMATFKHTGGVSAFEKRRLFAVVLCDSEKVARLRRAGERHEIDLRPQ